MLWNGETFSTGDVGFVAFHCIKCVKRNFDSLDDVHTVFSAVFFPLYIRAYFNIMNINLSECREDGEPVPAYLLRDVEYMYRTLRDWTLDSDDTNVSHMLTLYGNV